MRTRPPLSVPRYVTYLSEQAQALWRSAATSDVMKWKTPRLSNEHFRHQNAEKFS
jgi:hypothetical protein